MMAKPGMTMQELMEKIITNARASEHPARADDLEKNVRKCIDRFLPQYEKVLGIPALDILTAIEGRRDYWAPNFYQDSKWPSLDDDVRVFETTDDFLASIKTRAFRCPACAGVSKDHVTCDTGIPMKNGQRCDWKAYGLFGTLGKGAQVVIKSTFLEAPVVHSLFMPVAWEKVARTG